MVGTAHPTNSVRFKPQDNCADFPKSTISFAWERNGGFKKTHPTAEKKPRMTQMNTNEEKRGFFLVRGRKSLPEIPGKRKSKCNESEGYHFRGVRGIF
jgi:hypothetical protein